MAKKRFYSGDKVVRNQNGDPVERYANNNGRSSRGWSQAGTISVGRAGDADSRNYDNNYAGRSNGRNYDGGYAGRVDGRSYDSNYAGRDYVGRSNDRNYDMNSRVYDGDYAGRGNDRFNTGRLYDGDYAGPLNVARRQEVKDFSMISEDRRACANLPQNEIYHAWPKSIPYAEYHLDDTIRGVDQQERDDVMGMINHVGGNKW